jgi:hypothetical protein
MQRVILCEGKTDAIILSYFLEKCFGWESIRPKSTEYRNIPTLKINSLRWYQNIHYVGKHLAVVGCGGIEQIPGKLQQIIERTQSETEESLRFNKIVIVIDSDTRTKEECIDLIKIWLTDCHIELRDKFDLQEWLDVTIKLNNQKHEEFYLKVLLIVLPQNTQGNLETFLIESLKDYSEENNVLVTKSESFMEKIEHSSIRKEALRKKALLGLVLSIISPGHVLSERDIVLKSIPWENLKTFHAYKQLEDL